MSDSPRERGRRGPSTRAVLGGERTPEQGNTVGTPIHQTSTFFFRDSAEVRAYAEGKKPRDEYGRYSNPTWRAVEGKLCELEGAEAAVLFASGMCAATTTLPRAAAEGRPPRRDEATATAARASSRASTSRSSASR